MTTRTLLILAVALISASARAAGVESHGGGGFICDDPARNEVLDLWEGRIEGLAFDESPLMGLEPPRRTVIRHLDYALARLRETNPILADRVDNARNFIMNPMSMTVVNLPREAEIAPPADARHRLIKSGCVLKGIAQYVEGLPPGDRLFIDPVHMSALTPLNQAALWLHEAIYKVLRASPRHGGEGAKDSRRTRELVALLLSNGPIEGPYEGIPAGAAACYGGTVPHLGRPARFAPGEFPSEAYLFRDPATGRLALQFVRLQGQWYFRKSRARMSSETQFALLNQNQVQGFIGGIVRSGSRTEIVSLDEGFELGAMSWTHPGDGGWIGKERRFFCDELP